MPVTKFGIASMGQCQATRSSHFSQLKVPVTKFGIVFRGALSSHTSWAERRDVPEYEEKEERSLFSGTIDSDQT